MRSIESDTDIQRQITSLETETERVNALPTTTEASRIHLTDWLRRVKDLQGRRA